MDYREWKLLKISPNLEKYYNGRYSVMVVNGGESVYWFLNGKNHREDGPAIERFDGNHEWWKDGKRFYPTDHILKLWKAGNL